MSNSKNEVFDRAYNVPFLILRKHYDTERQLFHLNKKLTNPIFWQSAYSFFLSKSN